MVGVGIGIGIGIGVCSSIPISTATPIPAPDIFMRHRVCPGAREELLRKEPMPWRRAGGALECGAQAPLSSLESTKRRHDAAGASGNAPDMGNNGLHGLVEGAPFESRLGPQSFNNTEGERFRLQSNAGRQ